jgi:hypothetical protein
MAFLLAIIEDYKLTYDLKYANLAIKRILYSILSYNMLVRCISYICGRSLEPVAGAAKD